MCYKVVEVLILRIKLTWELEDLKVFIILVREG